MLQFEFRAFPDEAQGAEQVTFERFRSDSGAKSHAGRLAKRINGPVDIARAGAAPWEDRYMTTAHVAEASCWRAGYRFYRIE